MVKMSMASRLEYLKEIKNRYLKTEKKGKTKMLDEYCENTGLNRKYVTRRLSPKTNLSIVKNKPRKRTIFYTKEDIFWLAKTWEILDYPCGQRLKPVLIETIKILRRHHELNVPETIEKKLEKISSATIDDRLKNYRKKILRKINGTTKPGSLLKKQIPIKTSSWDEKRVGHCELDTVAHCGDNAGGDFINSLNLTDILTQWTEGAAIMGKAQVRIQNGLESIRQRLPFTLAGIDPDNGSEFINWQLYNYCAAMQIEFTRGRPYKKNDNAHIEQKNWTHVRKVFGYSRFETEKHLNLMNDLYNNELRLYKNFFIPCIKLVDKKRTGKHGEKIKRIYDVAKTPFQRVLECDQVSDETKQQLMLQHEKLNPAELRRNILLKLSRLSKFNN